MYVAKLRARPPWWSTTLRARAPNSFRCTSCDDGDVGYRYEDLGDEEFQRLIQALVTEDGSRRARALPTGQGDGGRDAVDGTTTTQVKFSKDGARKANANTWLLAALDGEDANIRGLVSRGTRHYVLATNVAGTATLDTGTIDRLDLELRKREAAWGLDTLVVWWRDDVDAHMSGASTSLKLRFSRALLGEELLALTLLAPHDTAEHLDRTLSAYVADQFSADNKVRFEQAGLNGPTVEKLFVDVPVTCSSPSSPAGLLLDRLGSPLDAAAADGRDGRQRQAAGAARLLLHPDWTGDAVIVGGPGQGKTTLLQSVCQFQRARHLRDAGYEEQLRPNGPVSQLARVPFRVELRRYATWSARAGKSSKGKGKGGQALEVFLAGHVSERSGGRTFTVEDLAHVVANRPVLLALDGLDEVASMAERERVAAEIEAAALRLRSSALDLVVLVATRPGATSVGSLLGDRFPALHLQRLTEALRLRYLDRWASQAGLGEEDTTRLRQTFVDNYQLPHVRELAANPMQLAILLDLLQRRGLLPEQRTRLYDDYVRVFLDREAPKEPLVNEHRALVEEVHAYLAWHLQSTAEADGGSGAVGLDQLRALLGEFLKDKGKKDQKVLELFQALTQRVICLVQRESGTFEFEVQPLREYFAARHVFDNAPARGDRNSRDDCLGALLTRPYWSNVLRFLAGNLSKIEVRGLPSSLRTAASQEPFDRLPLLRSVAAQLLDDQVFRAHDSGPIREMVDVTLDGPGVVLAADGFLDLPGGRFVLTDDTVREQVAAHCRDRLTSESDRQIQAALARVLLDHDEAAAVRHWWWADCRATSRAWLESAADLRALSGIDDEQASHVLQCALAIPTEGGQPLVALLLHSGSDTAHRGLLNRCLLELAAGATEPLEPDNHNERPVARLVRSMRPSRFLGPIAEPLHLAEVPQRRTRIRGNRRAGPADPTARLEALHGAPGAWDAARGLAGLGLLREIAGDSWLLRQTALSIPADLLPTSSGPASIA